MSTREAIKTRTNAMDEMFGSLDPAVITPQMVAEWVAGQALKPSSLRKYVQTLRAILDYSGVDPNPARDKRVKLPREEHVELEPPSEGDVVKIVAHTSKRYRLAVQTLAETGLRVGELSVLEYRDVDEAASRFRVRFGKTAAARRWVAVPPHLMATIGDSWPPDDRTPERRVFPGATPDTVRLAMRRACQAAGIAIYSPHDLRHHYASVQVARGVPLPMLAAHLGHSKKSLTLDTYSHVLLKES
jgi:integrase